MVVLDSQRFAHASDTDADAMCTTCQKVIFSLVLHSNTGHILITLYMLCKRDSAVPRRLVWVKYAHNNGGTCGLINCIKHKWRTGIKDISSKQVDTHVLRVDANGSCDCNNDVSAKLSAQAASISIYLSDR